MKNTGVLGLILSGKGYRIGCWSLGFRKTGSV